MAVYVDFIRIESYVVCQSGGQVKVVGINNSEILNKKDVLIVEDVVESGETNTKVLEHVNKFQPNSVKVASQENLNRSDTTQRSGGRDERVKERER